MSDPSSVRSLRYALGCALADSVDEAGRRRTSEAVAELDLALAEAGDDPNDLCIKLAAGRILESSDPAQALRRYVSALHGDTADEAVTHARALLEASPNPAALAAPLSTDELDTLGRLAQESEQTTLLASTLLRLRGRDAEALQLLERVYENARRPGRDVVVQLAVTRLDLDQVDQAVALVESEDPGGRTPSLQLVRAHGLMIRGEFEAALELASRLLSIDGSEVPALRAVAALSMLGLNRLDEARSILPAGEEPEIELARAIVSLQRREYQPAREAASVLLRSHPNDPDVLLVNAQTVVESLGTSQSDEASDLESSQAGSEGQTPGGEIDAARRLMADVAQALAELPPRLRWWRAQASVRANDARYRYFSNELWYVQHSGPESAADRRHRPQPNLLSAGRCARGDQSRSSPRCR